MNRLRNALRWDLIMLWKYGLLYAGFFVAVIWILILFFLPSKVMPLALPVLIFSDIATTGFFFIAVVLFFERSQGTISAVAVTPLTPGEYILSKVLALSLFSFGLAIVITGMAVMLKPVSLNWIYWITGSLLLVFFYILLGFRVVLPYTNFTNYLSATSFYLVLLSLPLLDFFGVTGTHWISYVFYLLPTHAVLLLFKAAFMPVNSLDIIYALVYPVVIIVILSRLAYKVYGRIAAG